MNISNPTVSVVMPVYNLERYAATAVESLKRQTLGSFEVIVIDDGSTDNSLAVLTEAAGDDPRFVIISVANGGAMQARKRGIERACGQYLCFVDGDDYVEPDFLERLTEAAEDGRYDMVRCAGYVRVTESYRTIIREELPPEMSGCEYIRRALCAKSPAFMCDKLYCRRLFDSGLSYNALPLCEDLCLNIQILCRTQRIRNIDYAGYNYVQRAGSAVRSHNSPEMQMQIGEALAETFRNNPEVAAAVDSESLLAVHGVWWYCRYIERSHNRWTGNSAYAVRLRERAGKHRSALRENLCLTDRMMFSLDKWRVLRPAVIILSTLKRWRTSLGRRLSKQR